MDFNKHYNLTGTHAFLSASKYHWINYDNDKLDNVYIASLAAQRGTELHAFAHQAIRLGIKQKQTSKTLNMFVNDCISWRMASEQILYFSDNCYGTADAISFRRNLLRISDLKTGLHPGHVHQLEIYAALFCLEYGVKPATIAMELRIYQNDDVDLYEGDADMITHIMDKIITFDKRINTIRERALS